MVGGGRLWRLRWWGLSVVGNFRRFRAFYGFCGTFAVGVFGFDGYRLAFVRVLQGVARALPYFFAISEPAVGDLSHAVVVFEVVAGGQGFAHFGVARDGDAANGFVVGSGRLWRLRGRCGVAHFGGGVAADDFSVSGAVGVDGFHRDGFAFVGRLDGVGRAGAERGAAGKPAVIDVGGHAVGVMRGRGQGLAHFGVTCDGDAAGLVVARWLRLRCRCRRVFYRDGRVAGYAFGVLSSVAVFGFDGDGFVFVAGLHGVALALPYFLSACKPAVGDGAESVVVFNVVAGGQGFAHFRLARDGDFACRRVVERADGRDVRLRVAYLCGRRAGEGFVMTQVVFVFDVYGQCFAFVARLDGVARAGRAGDGVAVGKPLVFDVLRLHAVCVFNFGEQGLSDFGRADEFDFAFLVVGGVGVVDGDFGAVVAGVAVAVVQDVFDRIGVAVFEFFVRGEGDVAATAHGPHALFFNDEAGDGVFVFVQQFDGVRVYVALGVGVVFNDVDGDCAAALFDFDGVVVQHRLVGFQVRVRDARMPRHLRAGVERVGRRIRVGLRYGGRVRRRLRQRRGDGVANAAGSGAGVRFVMSLAVGVVGIDADVFATVGGGEGIGRAGRAGDGVAVGKPLVFDGAGLHAVVIGDHRFQGAADFGFAVEGDDAFAVRLLVRVVGQGDFRRLAGVAFLVADGVLHRGRVAFEAGFGLEDNVSVEGDVPFAFAGDFQDGGRFASGIEQAHAVHVDVRHAVRVGVVFQDVNGDGITRRSAFFVVVRHGGVARLGLVGIRIRCGVGLRRRPRRQRRRYRVAGGNRRRVG